MTVKHRAARYFFFFFFFCDPPRWSPYCTYPVHRHAIISEELIATTPSEHCIAFLADLAVEMHRQSSRPDWACLHDEKKGLFVTLGYFGTTLKVGSRAQTILLYFAYHVLTTAISLPCKKSLPPLAWGRETQLNLGKPNQVVNAATAYTQACETFAIGLGRFSVMKVAYRLLQGYLYISLPRHLLVVGPP